MSEFFSGEKLFGDDFSEKEIEKLFEDEAEAYIKKITIIEPSLQTRSKKIDEIIPLYISPSSNDKIDFMNDIFDLIICFNTLHHIPNVSICFE